MLCALGGRSGQSMVDKIQEKVPLWLSECGATVAYQRDPFAVAIITPLMKRSYSADFAKDVCFVDSTASCDADNHILTFMITVTAAGAVPLGVMIINSASAASYISGFTLLKSILPEQSFASHGYPSVFLTDDSDAERTALQTCWPDADLKLCLFHVPQAVWCWLWSEQQNLKRGSQGINDRVLAYCLLHELVRQLLLMRRQLTQKLLVNTKIISSTYNIGGNNESYSVYMENTAT